MRGEGKGVCFSGLLTGLCECVWASGHSALACCSRWERNKDSAWIGCWVSAGHLPAVALGSISYRDGLWCSCVCVCVCVYVCVWASLMKVERCIVAEEEKERGREGGRESRSINITKETPQELLGYFSTTWTRMEKWLATLTSSTDSLIFCSMTQVL